MNIFKLITQNLKFKDKIIEDYGLGVIDMVFLSEHISNSDFIRVFKKQIRFATTNLKEQDISDKKSIGTAKMPIDIAGAKAILAKRKKNKKTGIYNVGYFKSKWESQDED